MSAGRPSRSPASPAAACVLAVACLAAAAPPGADRPAADKPADIPARYAGFFRELGLTAEQQQKFRLILDKYLADRDAGRAPDMAAMAEMLKQVNLTGEQQERLKGVVDRWNASRMKAAQTARPARPAPARAPKGKAELLVEAEGFTERGGWVVDQQFMDEMGSPYLLAHGLGRPAANAATTVTFPAAGEYRLWVRTKDWVPTHHPGRFEVLLHGKPAGKVFGASGKGWDWEDAGTVSLPAGQVKIELRDLTGFDGRCDALYFTADLNARPPLRADTAMAAWRRKLLGLPAAPPSAGSFDVVVVGGGIAGTAAALAAARLGSRVALVQDRPVLGGNNSPEVRVHTGGAASHVIREIDGGYGHAPGAWAWWEEPSKPTAAAWRRQKVVDAERNIVQFLGWHAYGVVKDANAIAAVDARDILTGRELRFAAPVFIDCTGDGSVGFWAGADYRTGREARSEHDEPTAPVKADKMTLGTSILWGSRDAGKGVDFPDVPWATEASKGLAATSGNWTWEYGHWLDTVGDAEEIRDHLLRAIYGAFAAAKRAGRDGGRPTGRPTANLELGWVGYVGGKRESRRLLGDHILTERDVRSGRRFPDAVATGSWSIDLHYPKGYDFRTYCTQSGVRPYPIPFRCLYSRNVGNLLMAGRDVSVTHVALGSTRVMNTCGQMGVAAGAAAHLCAKHNTTPRGVYAKHLAELLEIVTVRFGQKPPAAAPKTRPPPAPAAQPDTPPIEPSQ